MPARVSASASDALERVIVRSFAVLRALAVVLLPCYVSVWWPWYVEHPLGMAAAVVAGAWGVTFVAVSLTKGLGHTLAAANVVVAVGLAAAAPHILPEASVGAPTTWVFVAATHACIVASWLWSSRVFGVVVGVVAAVTVAGGASAPARVGVAVVILVSMTALFRFAAVRFRGIVARADARLEVAAARYRTETVAATRARDQRECERVVHDTVLNTLTGIGWGGGGENIDLTRSQCAQASTEVRALLDGADHELLPRDLEERLDHVVGMARAEGLDVERAVTLVAGSPADAGASAVPTVPPVPPVPPDVVSAFAAAVTETLANVRRHAGVDRARVEVRRDPAAVTMVVRDDGVGFDPARVPGDRLGLRRSVRGRLNEVGGRVVVESAPGRGTAVTMTWQVPPSLPAASGWDGDRRGDRGVAKNPMTQDPEKQAQDNKNSESNKNGWLSAVELGQAYAGGLRHAIGTVVAAWQFVMLVPLLAGLSRVHFPVLSGAVWVAMTTGVMVAVRVTRRRPLSRVEAAGLVALGLVATVAGGANTQLGEEAARATNWPMLVLGLLVAVVAVSRPPAEWLVALAVSVMVPAVVVFARAGVDPLPVSQLIMMVYGQCAMLTLVTMTGPVLRRTAEQTAQAIRAEAELAVLQDTEVGIREDRARGLGAIERDVLPLLAAISEGLLDPRDPAVRDRCVRHAHAVRRTLAAGQSAVLGDLAPALVEAEGRGVHLEINVSGDLRRAPAQVRRELADQVAGALQDVPREGTMLTVICDSAGGCLFLTYPDDNIPTSSTPGVSGSAGVSGSPDGPPSHSLVHLTTDAGDGRICMEMYWNDTRQAVGCAGSAPA